MKIQVIHLRNDKKINCQIILQNIHKITEIQNTHLQVTFTRIEQEFYICAILI